MKDCMLTSDKIVITDNHSSRRILVSFTSIIVSNTNKFPYKLSNNIQVDLAKNRKKITLQWHTYKGSSYLVKLINQRYVIARKPGVISMHDVHS